MKNSEQHSAGQQQHKPLPRAMGEDLNGCDEGGFHWIGTMLPQINPDKLYVNLFKGFDFTGGQSFYFPHRKLTSPLNSAALLHSL